MSHNLDPLYPLSEIYLKMGLNLPLVYPINEKDVPEPYKRLLVHERDMTSTLEAAFNQNIYLKVLQKSMKENILIRQVLLLLDQDDSPVEFGAIKIYLNMFSYSARRLILEGEQPLGAVLHKYHIKYFSSPIAFFRVIPDQLINQWLEGQVEGSNLYGRRNVLRNNQQEKIAEILEILPAISKLLK
jgi:chorismate-pyruvate lyase